MPYTAVRGTLRCIITGVNKETVSGMAEYKIAVIDDMTCCSAQKSRPYGSAIMVRLRTKTAVHWLRPRGHGRFCSSAAPSSNAPAATKRSAAASNGGTSCTTTQIARHVLTQTKQTE